MERLPQADVPSFLAGKRATGELVGVSSQLASSQRAVATGKCATIRLLQRMNRVSFRQRR